MDRCAPSRIGRVALCGSPRSVSSISTTATPRCVGNSTELLRRSGNLTGSFDPRTDPEVELFYREYDETPVTRKFLCAVVKGGIEGHCARAAATR